MKAAGRFTVLIVGGGVAALEAVLALHELAGDRVDLILLTTTDDFCLRPLSVLDPFPGRVGRRYDLHRLAADAGAELCHGRLGALDADRRRVRTDSGTEMAYDALLLAYGAEIRPRFSHARTIDDRRLRSVLRDLVQDVEEGYVRNVAFLAASAPVWPLPVYELALLTARAGYDTSAEVTVRLITPESRPLAIFGPAASRRVRSLLEHHHVQFVTAADADVPATEQVVLAPEIDPLEFQSIVAMPQLEARPIAGVPGETTGFIPVDRDGAVPGLEDVWAAGDAIAFPVKHGSLAAQQADAAAAAIARRAGANVEPEPFDPIVRGQLLGGERSLYLEARLRDGRPADSRCSEEPLWRPATTIAARRLGPYLHHADVLSGSFPPAALP